MDQQVYAKNRRGYITLISTLIVAAIATTIVTVLILTGLDASRSSKTVENGRVAYNLANACIEYALQQIRDDDAFVGSGNLTFGINSCSYSVTDDGGEARTIDGIGSTEKNTISLQALIDQINPTINITSFDQL